MFVSKTILDYLRSSLTEKLIDTLQKADVNIVLVGQKIQYSSLARYKSKLFLEQLAIIVDETFQGRCTIIYWYIQIPLNPFIGPSAWHITLNESSLEIPNALHDLSIAYSNQVNFCQISILTRICSVVNLY